MVSLRLRTQLIAYCTAITLLLTGAIIAMYSGIYKENAVNNLISYGKAVTSSISFGVAEDLITENYAPLQEYVRESATLANVESIQIANNQGDILAASDMRLLGTVMEREDADSEQFLSNDPDVWVTIDSGREQLIVSAPIVISGMRFGKARVYLSMKPILAHLWTMQRNAALTGLVFWLIAVFVGSLLAQRMSDSVQRFMQATESISQGDFNAEIPAHKGVLELEHFSHALHAMAGAIASRELALRNSEKKFRQLFERAMDGIFAADHKGQLLDVNPAFITILGAASREIILGQNLFANIFENEESLAHFLERMNAAGFVKDYELTLIASNSKPFIASLTCHAVKNDDGSIDKYEGMLRDVTAQKTAVRDIARMRNYLNNIIESMPSMLVTLDSDSTVTQWNTAAVQLTGIPSREAIGRKIYDIAPFFSKYTQQVTETNRSRNPVTLHREQVQQDPGHLYNLTFFPLVANGTAGVAIRVDDITELENKEQQLRQAQKMESIGTLAGGLAHDFNNVLAGILGNLSLLQYKVKHQQQLAPGELEEYLDRMENASQRAVDMVRQLLTLCHKHQGELVPVDLNLSLDHVRKVGENTFDKSVQIRVHPFDTPALVLADITEMEQILLNLCINAVHAMTIMREDAPWGGILSAAIEKVVVDPVFKKKHPEAIGVAYWRVSVHDNGVGMDTKTAAKIFDPFFTTKEQGKGTGLGLAMVYNIVHQNQGFVDVYSEPGLGSTFNVYLPVLEGKGEGGRTGADQTLMRGEGLVLVVDDDALVRSMAEEVLQTVGYSVLTAANGQEGVDLYRQHHERISAVLLDLAMPVMSGREAFIEMRKTNPQVKALLVSGFRKDNRVEEILQLGVKDFLQKPYTVSSLAQAIAQVIKAA